MFGEKLRGNIDTKIPPREYISYLDPSSYCEFARSRDVELHEKVTRNMESAQERIKDVFDKKTKPNISP